MGSDVGSTPADEREQALGRLKAKQAFYGNLASFVVINALLWIIWAITDGTNDGSVPWPVWVTAAWGVGLVLHALTTFATRPISEADVDREVERQRGRF